MATKTKTWWRGVPKGEVRTERVPKAMLGDKRSELKRKGWIEVQCSSELFELEKDDRGNPIPDKPRLPKRSLGFDLGFVIPEGWEKPRAKVVRVKLAEHDAVRDRLQAEGAYVCGSTLVADSKLDITYSEPWKPSK